MLCIRERMGPGDPAAVSLTLCFEDRARRRLRTRLDDGREVALLLPRGPALRHGEQLRAENGLLVEVRAAPEPVSTARAEDSHLLARACYHLGNRHVQVEIGPGYVRYPRDSVLDRMLEKLGLPVEHDVAPFEPEGGAYEGGHGHTHARHGGHGAPHRHPHPGAWSEPSAGDGPARGEDHGTS